MFADVGGGFRARHLRRKREPALGRYFPQRRRFAIAPAAWRRESAGVGAMSGGSGHNPGTAAPQAVEPQGLPRRAQARQSCVPSWPRLLTLPHACEYLSLGKDALLGYVRDGTLRTVRPPRPHDARSAGFRQGPSRRKLADQYADTLRRVLFDRDDLDALVDRWKREGWN